MPEWRARTPDQYREIWREHVAELDRLRLHLDAAHVARLDAIRAELLELVGLATTDFAASLDASGWSPSEPRKGGRR